MKPTEDNPHAAVFDEMADDLYQTMLQEQAKEEAAAGLLPAQTNASATGWTNDSNIQYNMQEEISAVPIAQQEYLWQFWDETKQRFSAVKLLFDTQPYGSFQPAFAVADGKGLPDYSNDNTVSHIGQLNSSFKQIAVQKKSNTITNQSEENKEVKNGSSKKDYQKTIPEKELNELPVNVQEAYNKYNHAGWKGNVPGQTAGTVAGAKYQNRDRKLPTIDDYGNPIMYKEWDVNNKQPGAFRDRERFVTGSDGSIYYTDSHYGEGSSPTSLLPFIKIH